MVYTSQKQMDTVLGKLDDNGFINQQKQEFKKFRTQVDNLVRSWKL